MVCVGGRVEGRGVVGAARGVGRWVGCGMYVGRLFERGNAGMGRANVCAWWWRGVAYVRMRGCVRWRAVICVGVVGGLQPCMRENDDDRGGGGVCGGGCGGGVW